MTIEEAKEMGATILDEVPQGWKCMSGTRTAPEGYLWYWNQKSQFGGEYEEALVKEKGAEKA